MYVDTCMGPRRDRELVTFPRKVRVSGKVSQRRPAPAESWRIKMRWSDKKKPDGVWANTSVWLQCEIPVGTWWGQALNLPVPLVSSSFSKTKKTTLATFWVWGSFKWNTVSKMLTRKGLPWEKHLTNVSSYGWRWSPSYRMRLKK